MFFFLPFRIDRPFRLPVVTITLIAINVLIFALSQIDLRGVVDLLGFRVNEMSALYTWFTGLFLHADIFHVGWNMYYLWVFGSVVEDAAGRGRFLALYLMGGLLASLTNAAITWAFVPDFLDVPLIGASGAVAAVMGVFAVRLWRHKLQFWYFVWVLVFVRVGKFALPSLVAIGLWLLRELVAGFPALLGFPSSVANWAHIGGLLFGAALAAATGLLREAGTEQLAEEALQQTLSGNHAAAAGAYRKLAGEEPDNPDWTFRKAREQRAAGRTDDITLRRDVTRAIKMLVARGDRDAAADAYLEFRSTGVELGLDRSTVQALASASESRGQLDTAAHLYYELATKHPGTREGERSHFRLAHVYLGLDRLGLARETWESFVRTYDLSEWTEYADARLASSETDGWVPPGVST